MFDKGGVVLSICFSVFLGAACNLVYGEAGEDGIDVAKKVKVKAPKVTELEGGGDVCRWVASRFDPQTAVLNGAYSWKNVKAELLEYPKEYYGYIKHLSVDVDNDGDKELLAKVTTYLGGTLSALNLVVADGGTLLKAPVNAEKILIGSSFSLNERGEEKFLEVARKLKEAGVSGSDPRMLYGYSAYQLQNKLIDVFSYRGKNYLLLNSYQDTHGDKLGLVVGVRKTSDSSLDIRNICFFR